MFIRSIKSPASCLSMKFDNITLVSIKKITIPGTATTYTRLFSQSRPASFTPNSTYRNKCQNVSHTKPSPVQHDQQPEDVKMTTLTFWSSPHHWKRAAVNTTRCLIGCTLGDFSALWFLQANFSDMGMGSIMAISSSPSPSPSSLPLTPFSPPQLTN